jgi:hypothetical protein
MDDEPLLLGSAFDHAVTEGYTLNAHVFPGAGLEP